MNQVWMNLIDNALDAVGEAGRVNVSASRRLASVIVRVVDNGIARQLVRRNNGDIDFESQPGHTVFRVRLPVAPPAA